jgi:hypothetical protein
VVHHITKLDNQIHILHRRYQLRNVIVILHPLTGHLNKDETAHSYFQQDGATAHTAGVFMTLLHNVLGDRIISKDIWPPWSPDYYYLWGAMRGSLQRQSSHST